MSKPETNIVSVPLANAYLNLNQEKDEVRNYDGFNKLNAPYYGGNLTPLWRKFLGASGSSSYTDENETVYKIEDGIFSKTERGGNTEVLKDDFQQYTAEETIFENRTYKWYYNENNYAAITDTGSVTVTLNGVVVGSYNNFENILFSENRAVIVTSTNILFYFNDQLKYSTLNGDKTSYYYTTPSFAVVNDVMVVSIMQTEPLYISFSEIGEIEILDIELNGTVSVYYATSNSETTITSHEININEVYTDSTLNYMGNWEDDASSNLSRRPCARAAFYWGYEGTLSVEDYKQRIEENYSKNIVKFSQSGESFLFSDAFLINTNMGAEAVYPNGMGFGNIEFYSYGLYNIYEVKKIVMDRIENGKLYFNLTIENKGYKYVIGSRSGGLSWETEYYNFSGYSETQLKEKCDEIYPNFLTLYMLKLTVESKFQEVATGYLYSYSLKKLDITGWDGTWSVTQDLVYDNAFTVLSTPEIINSDEYYNIATTRGCAFNISSHFRLLANNGYISAVSMFNDENCLGTLISNFGTTGIEYVYAVTDTRLVYVDDKNKVHVIDVIPFSGNEYMTVLLGRYFVFNSVGVNCYDVVARTWSRIGMDWNNRFIIADYSESTDTKYYMTSAIFRTTDNTPSLSMLFNADYLNHIPYTALTPQYAQDATIQLYGADEPNNSVLYLGSFVFSSNEWTVFTESSYDGTTAESNSDNNLLIPASLFTQYVTSYLNDIYAVMSDGFTPLYKNNNAASTIKFNYYIGSLISDLGLDALFILQGQYYRLSDKIIYAYSYSGGQLVDTQEICNVGSLSFVGASPSEAFFWSFANRTLYKFTGARTVESVMCADSVKAIYASLYDTTTSSLYVSTDIGLMVYNAFGNFIIDEIKMATELTSTKLGITYKDENRNLYGLYYNAVDGEDVIPVTLETAFYGASTVQNVINDTLYVKIFNKDKLSKGVVKFGGYIQQNYGETKELVSKTIEVTSSQFDKNTNVLLLRYQPDKQRGIGISWKIESDFPISFVGVGASQTSELNVPKGNSPVMTTQKYNI